MENTFTEPTKRQMDRIRPYIGMRYDAFTLDSCNDLGILYWKKGRKLYVIDSMRSVDDVTCLLG